jgi:uncharacterized protein (TIGR02453 family)
MSPTQAIRSPAPAHFTPEALKFLRGLARHNDRAWFDPRKPIFERELRAPMLALIEQLNHALAAVAPEHIRPSHKIMMRIYRDTRFDASRNQPARPYKTQIAAWFARAGMEKTSGAGFYFHLSATELLIAAGCYMPAPEQLLAIRRHIVEHHAELRALLANKKLRAKMSPFDSERAAPPLTRLPRGFSASDPNVLAAQDLILPRQWGVRAALPAEAATRPTLLKEIVTRFALAAPLVAFLNAPILRDTAKSQQIEGIMS